MSETKPTNTVPNGENTAPVSGTADRAAKIRAEAEKNRESLEALRAVLSPKKFAEYENKILANAKKAARELYADVEKNANAVSATDVGEALKLRLELKGHRESKPRARTIVTDTEILLTKYGLAACADHFVKILKAAGRMK